MNKKQAAEYLGLSIKSLERYTTQKRITVRYVKGAHGKEADYNQDDLDKLKTEIEANSLPEVAPAIEAKGTTTLATTPNAPYTPNHESNLVLSTDKFDKFLSLLEMMGIRTMNKEKLLLTVDEASLFTGASAGAIKKAIKNGELKKIRLGKAVQVKRADLEAWVKAL